jgi:hypothetical protein
MANRDATAGKAGVFLLFFAIFWCSLVGVFDFLIARSLVAQITSSWYQPTTARILKSETTSNRDSEGATTHGVKFEYTYSVNGTNYTGTHYTFDGSSSSDSGWARDAVATFPPGVERVCYYDPQDPSRAVLAPGLHGSDITHLMFMTPFNIVAGFLIAYPIWSWRERRSPSVLTPRFVDQLHGREGYSLNQYSPVMAFFGLFLLTSFIGIFVVVFTGGFHPSMTKVVTVWGAGLAIAVAITAHLHLKTQRGRYDLVFDENSRTVTVPPIRNRRSVEVVPMADVKKFDVEKVESGTGDDRSVTWQVKMVADGGREVLLQESYLERHAQRLAATFNTKLRIPNIHSVE